VLTHEEIIDVVLRNVVLYVYFYVSLYGFISNSITQQIFFFGKRVSDCISRNLHPYFDSVWWNQRVIWSRRFHGSKKRSTTGKGKY